MTTIYGPREIHAATSWQHLLTLATQYLNRQNVEWRQPRGLAALTLFPASLPPRLSPRVEWNRWVIACAYCGNWPSYSVEWKGAVCYECGAIYQNLLVDASPTTVEAELATVSPVPEKNWSPPVDATPAVSPVFPVGPVDPLVP